MGGFQRQLYVFIPYGSTVAQVTIYSWSPGWPEVPEQLRAALVAYAEQVGGELADNISPRP